MGGQADQRVRPDDLAGQCRWQVALAQVQHVGPGRTGDVGPVVDREQRAVPAGRAREDLAGGELVARLQRAEPLFTSRSLVAQLDDVHPAGQGGVGELGQVAALAPRVGTQIEPGGGKTGNTIVHTATLAR